MHIRIVGLILLLHLGAALAAEVLTLTPASQPVQREVPRLGLNLGGSSSWGAEQLRSNVFKNPGFEAPYDRSLVIVKDIGRNTVSDDSAWLARAEGFWNGGSFDVRTGAAAGSSGRILDASRADKNSPTEFYLDPMPAKLRAGDAIAVSVTRTSETIPMWWTSGKGRVLSSTAQVRPGSPGLQSLRLLAGPGERAQLLHHLDSIGARAGKLLLVDGGWELAFWARSSVAGQQLRLRFQRHGASPFLQQSVTLERDWKRYSLRFQGNEAPQAAPSTPLEFSFEIDQGEAWLDDAQLGPVASGAGGFRTEVVSMLKRLQPGYLRDWQGQLGDSIANRLAEPFARRPTRYRPGENELMYLYSLPEFFELCAAVGAQPWVIAPTLASDEEWRTLGVWLKQAAQRHGLREVILEFGNENWNAMFRPAGMVNATTHAAAADRAFRLVKQGAAGFDGLLTMVNAQYVNTGNVAQIARLSQEASRVAVAPYFLFSLPAGTLEQSVAAAFAEDDSLLRNDSAQASNFNKRLSVYEVNFHTTEGTVELAVRNATVSGAHAGAALARRLLLALLAGVREQAVYSLAGFDAQASNGRGLVKMWGITRDLAPGTLRPTGLALQLLNEAVSGDAYGVQCTGNGAACRDITALVFRQPGQVRLAVVSAATGSSTIRPALPCKRGARGRLRLLDGSASESNNETATQVAVRQSEVSCGADGWQFNLPAHSVAIFAELSALPHSSSAPHAD